MSTGGTVSAFTGPLPMDVFPVAIVDSGGVGDRIWNSHGAECVARDERFAARIESFSTVHEAAGNIFLARGVGQWIWRVFGTDGDLILVRVV